MSLSSFVSPIIIPFDPLLQLKTTPTPPFFHTLVHFILSSPFIFSPLFLSHNNYKYQCSSIIICLPYQAATGDSWGFPCILVKAEDSLGFPPILVMAEDSLGPLPPQQQQKILRFSPMTTAEDSLDFFSHILVIA
jgi:hypothetical protein